MAQVWTPGEDTKFDLASRLQGELDRRGQPMPKVPEDLTERPPGCLLREARNRRMMYDPGGAEAGAPSSPAAEKASACAAPVSRVQRKAGSTSFANSSAWYASLSSGKPAGAIIAWLSTGAIASFALKCEIDCSGVITHWFAAGRI